MEKEKKIRKNIAVDPSLWEDSIIYAKIHNTSVSQLIGDCLSDITNEDKDNIMKYKKVLTEIQNKTIN